MLTIVIPARDDMELYDESKNEFITIKGLKKDHILQLEHSLLSLSKWESKWHKPFLSQEEKTFEETIDYIKCMTLTKNVDPDIYGYLTNDNINEINRYIGDSMTATTFNDRSSKTSKEVVTSELIYYWMITLNVNFECEKWHLNRLLTLIRICNIKSQPAKKRTQQETISRYAELNAARRKKLNTKG